MNTDNKPLVDVQIYGPSFSNFVRTVMLICEEHNVSYQTGFELDGKAIAFKSNEHIALHPFGKLPVLKHGDFVLPETSTICRYLLKTFAPQYESYFSAEQQAHIDAFSAITSLYIDKAIIRDYLLEFAFPKGENGEVRLEVAKNAQAEVRRALQVIEQELLNGNVLNGEHLTLADALIAPMLHYLTTLPADFNLLTEYLALERYLESLMSRTSCQKVLVTKN